MARLFAICLALSLVVTASAAGKFGTTARLLGTPRLDAPAGAKIRVDFKLGIDRRTSAESAGVACRRDPGRYYVRLLSKTGGRATYGDADVCGRRYVARVRIPRGGVGDIEIKLRGWVTYPGGTTRRADAPVPITNDPFPG